VLLLTGLERKSTDVYSDNACRKQWNALRESEEMYRTFIERSNDGVVVLQDRLIKFVNPRFEEMSGYSADTLLGTVFTDYLTPEEVEHLLVLYERRMAGEAVPPIYETVMTRKGGAKISLEISAALISYQGRAADLVLVRDISERKEAQVCLERYRILCEHVRDIVLLIGFDGQILEANHAAVDTYGYSYEELLGLNARALRAEEEREAMPELLQRLQKENLLFESVHRRKDGTTFPVEVHAGAATINKEPVILGIVRDISTRKKTEAALERALREANRQGRRAAALQGIAEAALPLPKLPELLQAMAEKTANALDVDACCVFVLDERATVFEARAAYNVPGLVGCRVRADEGLIGRVALEGAPVYIADAEHDPMAYDACEVRTSAKSMLGVPLTARGRVIGVTRVQSLQTREFSNDEVLLLQAIADRAALAIDNTKLYEDLRSSRSEIEAALDTERHFSLLLQRALLPDHVSLGEGYCLAVRYVPAFASREIGGDFYDAFRAGDGSAVVLVGDVSGKGLEAASLAAATRSTVHAFAHETASASGVISKANSILPYEPSEAGAFVTVFLVIVDTQMGEVHYCSAGHPPAAILRADGSIEFLSAVDPPIGVLRTHAYRDHVSKLERGDTMVLYTDGISEARSDSCLFDLEGISRSLAAHAGSDCDDLADALVAAATDHAGGKLKDDAAVVVVHRQ